jgi:hypothetical protein
MRLTALLPLTAALCLVGSGVLAKESRAAEDHGWQKLDPKATVVDGKVLTPTCSQAPGTKPDFHFWVRRGTVNRLVVYFEGGGACWDDVTCSAPVTMDASGVHGFFKAQIGPTDNPAAYTGLFKLDDPQNPVRDWSFVYVPYCTADVHSGSATATYKDVKTGQVFQIEHRGDDNFRVILNWMSQHLKAPDQVLVTGSSAGAYGAVTQYPRVRGLYPKAKGALLGDAGQGVTTPSFEAARVEKWGYRLDPAIYGGANPVTETGGIVKRLAQTYPKDRFAQYTTANDLVQAQFFKVSNIPEGVLKTSVCQAWTDGMLAGVKDRQALANFRSYVAAGASHTILRGASPSASGITKADPTVKSLFQREVSGGQPFETWLGALLSRDAKGWDNQTCENCTHLPFACPF